MGTTTNRSQSLLNYLVAGFVAVGLCACGGLPKEIDYGIELDRRPVPSP